MRLLHKELDLEHSQILYHQPFTLSLIHIFWYLLAQSEFPSHRQVPAEYQKSPETVLFHQ